MCGIVGVISPQPLTKENVDLFKNAFKKTESRGRDACGIYHYPAKMKYRFTGSVSEMLDKEEDKLSSYIEKESIILGHTRASTQGNSENNDNNHPFSTKNFVMAHNGVINNDEDVRKLFKIPKKDIFRKGHKTPETDSYVIIWLIEHFYEKEKDVVKAIQETTKLIGGGYACWLFHKDTKDVYLFRNSNPIDIGFIPESNTILFASDEDFYEHYKENAKGLDFLGGFFNYAISSKSLEEKIIYKILYGNKKIEEYEFEIKPYGTSILPEEKEEEIVEEIENVGTNEEEQINDGENLDDEDNKKVLEKLGFNPITNYNNGNIKIVVPKMYKKMVKEIGFHVSKKGKVNISSLAMKNLVTGLYNKIEDEKIKKFIDDLGMSTDETEEESEEISTQEIEDGLNRAEDSI